MQVAKRNDQKSILTVKITELTKMRVALTE